jgi:hypothetical protein
VYWVQILKNVIYELFHFALAVGDNGFVGVACALPWSTMRRPLWRAARPANCAPWLAVVLLTMPITEAMAASDGGVAQSQESQALLKSQELVKPQAHSQSQGLSQLQEFSQPRERATAQQDGQPMRVFFR